MKKSVFLGICLSMLLTACGSGDKSDKNKQDFQPNSKIQVIPAAQMAFAQQQQDFPETRAAPAYRQYAVASNTTAMMPVDLSDADSGTSLPAMTEPTTPIQPVQIPASSAAQPANSEVPSFSAPDNAAVAPSEAQSFSAPSNAPAIPAIQNSGMQNSAPSITQPSNPVLNNSANAAVSNNNDMPVGWSNNQNRVSTQKAMPTQPVNESYEALREAPSKSRAVLEQIQTPTPASPPSSYANFDNVAIPVTFTNSPYNTQLNSFTNTPAPESSAPLANHSATKTAAEPAPTSTSEDSQP